MLLEGKLAYLMEQTRMPDFIKRLTDIEELPASLIFVSRYASVIWNPNKCDVFGNSGKKMETNVNSLDKSVSGEVLKSSL